MNFGSALTQAVIQTPSDAVALMGTHSARSVVLRAVTTTFAPVVALNVTRSDLVDHVMVGSVARAGVTVAPSVVPGPSVRMVGGAAGAPNAPPPRGAAPPPVNAMRKG